MTRALFSLFLMSYLIVSGLSVNSACSQVTHFNGVEVPGTVIKHSPASTNTFLASPSIVILPNGDYIVSHDYHGSGTSLARTDVYKSTDQGQTWSLSSVLFNQYWSNLFVHEGDLYILGTSGGYNDLVIRKSTNNGATWTTPSNSTNGIIKDSTASAAYHTAPVPVVVANGRIWRAFEDTGASGDWPEHFRAGMMSAPVGADLLDADSWEFTNTLAADESWLPYNPSSPESGGYFRGWLEGNAVVDPNGDVVNLLRIDVESGRPEHAAIARVESTTVLSIDHDNDINPMNGAAKKFTVRYSEQTGTYWTLSNIINQDNYSPSTLPNKIRNVVAVMQSVNLTDWTVEQIVLQDLSDVNNIGFQYWDWQFDGRDMVAVSRTAYPDGLGGAANYHDANFINFHRFEDILPAIALEGDLDGDGFVGITDLNIVLGAWNQSVPPGNAAADPSGDGYIGIEDLNVVLGNWNTGAPPDSQVNIPEPASLIFLGLGLLSALKR